MSCTAQLHIQGNKTEEKGLKILSYNMSFSQDVGTKGEVMSEVRPGLINISVQDTNDAELIHWMVGNDIRKNGKISLSGVIATGPHKSIDFEDGVLVSYNESFTDNTDTIINLSISARKITINGISHEMTWEALSED